MPPKTAAAVKRKGGPSARGPSHGLAKKPKSEGETMAKAQKQVEEEEEEEESWDSDAGSDGGVPLNVEDEFDTMSLDEEPRKTPKSKGKSTANSSLNSAGQTSRERHEEQKRLAKERKLAKPFGGQLHRLKKIWERLRVRSHVPKGERDTLLKELYDISTGHFKDLVMKHDAVRVVQTALKYSTSTQRKLIAKELKGSYCQLASNKYSKFLIEKLVTSGDDEIRDLIVTEFYGKVRKLMLNSEASWVLDDIYRKVATRQQKALLLREWYGPEFALFKDANQTSTMELAEILKEDPEKRSTVLKNLKELINPLIEKGWTAFTSLHAAMLQYFRGLKGESEERRQFMDHCTNEDSGDLIKHMCFTEPGSLLVCLLLANGTAKDRKLIIRRLQDAVQMMCVDAYGHAVILAAYEVVDDTVLLSKSILSQILAPGDDDKYETTVLAANDLYARTTLLYPFDGATKNLFPEALSRDLEILKEVVDIRKSTSKKDPEVRRMELVQAASNLLLGAIEDKAIDLVTTSFGSQLVTSVLLSGRGNKEAAVGAVAATASGDVSDPVHLSHVSFVGRMFKTLALGGRFNKELGKVVPVEPPLRFADALYEHIRAQEVGWACGPSSFVILSMLDAIEFSEKDALRQCLFKGREELKKAAIEGAVLPKARDGEEGNDEGQSGKKAGKKQDRKPPSGNTGTKLILEKLG